MDGIGGGSQEVTWQRYNGVRRSKFIPESDSLAMYDRRADYSLPPPPPKNKYGDMWTEITKDLVVREAIEELGYDYEETEYFYYIIQYLRYVRHTSPSTSPSSFSPFPFTLPQFKPSPN
jgi:hypothetical protein